MAFSILFKEILIVIFYICLLKLSGQETCWSFRQMTCRVYMVQRQTLWRVENPFKGLGVSVMAPTVGSIRKLSDPEIDDKPATGSRGFRLALSGP